MGKITINELHKSLYNYAQTVSDENLMTESKTIVNAINEIYGKQLIANAIGEPLNDTDTFTKMNNDINSLLSTFKTNMMNSGVTVESSDKIKQLIDKLKGLTEGEGNKGIQYAEGTFTLPIETGFVDDDRDNIYTCNWSCDFVPTILFVKLPTVCCYDDDKAPIDIVTNPVISNVYTFKALVDWRLSSQPTWEGKIENITTTTFDINVTKWSDRVGFEYNEGTWYAIGVGEEDTTLRDSLASILQDEGVNVTEEDDMASLITKVDEEFERKNVGKNGLIDVIKEKGVTKAEYTDSWETIYEYINKYFKCHYVNIDISPNTWATGTAMPKGLAFASSAAIGKKIYITGGYSSVAQKTVYIYDTETQQWSQGPNLNKARYGHKTVAVGTKLYVLCGEDTTSCECWDTENGTTWSNIKAYSYGYSAPYGACASEDGKYIYLLDYYDGHTSLSKYNIANNSWSKPESPYFGSDYSASNDHRFMVEVDGVLYVLFANKCLYTANFNSCNVVTSNAPDFSNEFGLATVFDSNTRRIITIENTKVHIFDLDTNKYNTISTGSTNLYGRFASCVDGIIYIFGGTTALNDYGSITGSTSTDTKIYMPPEE